MRRACRGLLGPAVLVAMSLTVPRRASAESPYWNCLQPPAWASPGCAARQVADGIPADLVRCQLPPSSVLGDPSVVVELDAPNATSAAWGQDALDDALAAAEAFSDNILPGSGFSVSAASPATPGAAWAEADFAVAITNNPAAPPYDVVPGIAAGHARGDVAETYHYFDPDGCYATSARTVMFDQPSVSHVLPTSIPPLTTPGGHEFSFRAVLLHEILHMFGMHHAPTSPNPTAIDELMHGPGDPGDPRRWDETLRITGPENLYLRAVVPGQGSGQNLMLHRFARPHEQCVLWAPHPFQAQPDPLAPLGLSPFVYAWSFEATRGTRRVWTREQMDCYGYMYEWCEASPPPQNPIGLNSYPLPTDITLAYTATSDETIFVDVLYALIPDASTLCTQGVPLATLTVEASSAGQVSLGDESLVPAEENNWGLPLGVPWNVVTAGVPLTDEEDFRYGQYYQDFYLCAQVDPANEVSELSDDDNTIVSDQQIRVFEHDPYGWCSS